MASRGALGGLSAAVVDGADVLDAAGFDYVLVETVGVGQSELDVAKATDTTLVVVTPESGDEVQTAKAGLMEIADVFVLNKDDRPDGNAMWNALRRMVDARQRGAAATAWWPPIVRTVASTGVGIEGLVAAVLAHHAHLVEGDGLALRRRARDRQRLLSLAAALLEHRLRDARLDARYDAELDAVAARRVSVHEAAAKIARAAADIEDSAPGGAPG
jgi:LAO/AO transport system kinase